MVEARQQFSCFGLIWSLVRRIGYLGASEVTAGRRICAELPIGTNFCVWARLNDELKAKPWQRCLVQSIRRFYKRAMRSVPHHVSKSSAERQVVEVHLRFPAVRRRFMTPPMAVEPLVMVRDTPEVAVTEPRR